MNSKVLIASGLVLAGVAGFMFGTTNPASQVSADDTESFGFMHRGMFGEGRQGMLEDKAEILGITVDQLEQKLETMTLYEVFQEAGIDEDAMHQQLQQKAQERWQELGLSDEEIQSRLEEMDEHHQHCGGAMGKAFRTGFRRGYQQNLN